MVKKLIQACAVLILVTAVIYGNKPIQQPEQTFGARRGGGFETPYGTAYFPGGGTAGGGQGFGMN